MRCIEITETNTPFPANAKQGDWVVKGDYQFIKCGNTWEKFGRNNPNEFPYFDKVAKS